MSLQQCAVIDGRLRIVWGETSAEFGGALLRASCRCAACRARELAGAEEIADDDVTVLAASPMGYGLQLHFSDGHNRGVFPWSYLCEIAGRSTNP